MRLLEPFSSYVYLPFQAWLVWLLRIFLILRGFLSHRKLNSILSMFLNVSIFGEGRTDNLYVSYDSRRNFITVVFPNRVSFLCPQMFYHTVYFLNYWGNVLVENIIFFGDTRMPGNLSGSFVPFNSRLVSLLSYYLYSANA